MHVQIEIEIHADCQTDRERKGARQIETDGLAALLCSLSVISIYLALKTSSGLSTTLNYPQQQCPSAVVSLCGCMGVGVCVGVCHTVNRNKSEKNRLKPQ